jgi:hypothetical protein
VSDNKLKPEGTFRNTNDVDASKEYAAVFNGSKDTTEMKLHNFPKYARRQDMTKLLARYEIFKRVLHAKGSIVECGVFRGAGVFSWGLFSEILEPVNLTRRIYGFDTFSGFPAVNEKDMNKTRVPEKGDLSADVKDELLSLITAFDKNRFLGHIGKISLIDGDATETIPKFISENRHLVVSLLFLDFDLYEPTRVALENFVPRMPKGSVIAFDELDNPIWPGETLALLETIGIKNLKIERLDFDPYIGFAVID